MNMIKVIVSFFCLFTFFIFSTSYEVREQSFIIHIVRVRR